MSRGTRRATGMGLAAVALMALGGIVLVGAAPLAVAGSADQAPAGAVPGECRSVRGTAIAVTDLATLSRDQVATALRDGGLAAGATHGVRLARVTYCTITPTGASTVASGLLAVPQGVAGALPAVVYAHGTVTKRTDAPSFLGTTEARIAPLVFAAEGFAVVAPDYVGLGVSPVAHPYLHAATEASAAVDLLWAVRTASATTAGAAAPTGSPPSRVQLTGDVFVTGHSQGGQAAMAIGRSLSQGQPGRGAWRLRALAPMAGPYDMSGILLPAAVDPARTDPAAATVDLAYLLTSWKSVYHLYSDPYDVFAAPYAGIVEELFAGNHGLAEAAAALPDSPTALLRPETLALVSHPTGSLAEALRDNDVCRWTPRVPVRLYVGSADRDVVPEHAQRCRDQIAMSGGTAEVVDLGEVDHVGTAIAALPQIRAWFSSL